MAFGFQKLRNRRSDTPDDGGREDGQERTSRPVGVGLPSRTLPKLVGAMAVAFALYVAFGSKHAPQQVATAPSATPAATQANARPHRSELRSILTAIEGKHHPHGAKPQASASSQNHSSVGSRLLSGVLPSPRNIKADQERNAARRGNVAASSIIALQGSPTTNGASASGPSDEPAGTSRYDVPNGQLTAPTTHIALPKQRTRSSHPGRSFLSRMAKEAGHGYGPQASILPPLPGAVLYPGAVIPATTITAVNTQLPGSVIAQVTDNVYGRNGRVAVPAGSRLVGKYDTSVQNGQTRVLVAFSRVIFPGGRELVLGNALSAGKHGTAGTPADVHNHFFTMLGASLLVALLDQGVSAAGPSQNVTSPTGATYSSPGQAGAQVFADSASKVLSPYMDVRPTAVIPSGTSINVLVNKTVTIPQQIGAGQ